MFGLLGPNGAGKSSLMRTVATLQDPDSGSIDLDGLNVLTQKDEVRKILGYLPQEFGVYPKLSALDMLQHLAVMKGVTNQTNLWDARKMAVLLVAMFKVHLPYGFSSIKLLAVTA